MEHVQGGQCPFPAHSAHIQLVTPLLALRWQVGWLACRAIYNTCRKTRKTLVKVFEPEKLWLKWGFCNP